MAAFVGGESREGHAESPDTIVSATGQLSFISSSTVELNGVSVRGDKTALERVLATLPRSERERRAGYGRLIWIEKVFDTRVPRESVTRTVNV